jgi:hypothetical protein
MERDINARLSADIRIPEPNNVTLINLAKKKAANFRQSLGERTSTISKRLTVSRICSITNICSVKNIDDGYKLSTIPRLTWRLSRYPFWQNDSEIGPRTVITSNEIVAETESIPLRRLAPMRVVYVLVSTAINLVGTVQATLVRNPALTPCP